MPNKGISKIAFALGLLALLVFITSPGFTKQGTGQTKSREKARAAGSG